MRAGEELICKVVSSPSLEAGGYREASGLYLELQPSLDSHTLGMPLRQPGLRARMQGKQESLPSVMEEKENKQGKSK